MLIVLGVILIALVAAGMVFLLTLNQKNERKRHMMRVVQGASAVPESKEKKGSAQDQRRHDLAKKLKEAGKEEDEEKKKGKKAGISELIMHAGLNISVAKFWVFSIILCVVCTSGAYVAGQSPLVILTVMVTSLLGIPKLFLKMKAGKRQKLFLESFADALDSMTRLLKAGMPVSEAIKMVAREYGGPVGEEMSRIFDQQKIGVPLAEAVLEGAKRMPLPEMNMFATAISIQAQTGSSLSEVLENLAEVIRQRFALKRKVKALSAEAKASAGIIAALPCVVCLAMFVINPDYILLLFQTPFGNVLLGGAIFWMFLGVVVMRQMINFRV
jgi:tight adherence protein B